MDNPPIRIEAKPTEAASMIRTQVKRRKFFLLRNRLENICCSEPIRIPAGILIGSVQQIFSNLFLRRKNFRLLTWVRIIEAASVGFASILMGGLSIGLIIGALVGQMCALGILTYFALRDNQSNFRWLGMKKYLAIARSYSDFPKIN